MIDDELAALASEMIQAHVPTGTYDDRWLSGLTDGTFANVPTSVEVTYMPVDRLSQAVSELKAFIGHADCDGFRVEDGATVIICGCGLGLLRKP